MQSPLLRLTYTAQANTATLRNYGQITSQVEQDAVFFSLPGVPAYYVVLQFTSKLELESNFSAISSNKDADTAGSPRFTIPACALYNGVAYVPCKGCNISSYTDYNVTYSCFDISQLCPLSSVNMNAGAEYYSGSRALIVDGNDSSDSSSCEEVKSSGIDAHCSNARSLSLNDSISATPSSSLSYGVVLQSVKAEMYNVLTTDPMMLDLAHSKVVLIFMGCLSGSIIIMMYYLLRKDHNEKMYKTYVKSEADNLARKLLKDEIRKGGSGDLGLSFQTQVKSLNVSLKSIKSSSTLLYRTLSGKVDNYKRHQGASFLGVDFDFDERESTEYDSDFDDSDDSVGRDGGDDNVVCYDDVYSGANNSSSNVNYKPQFLKRKSNYDGNKNGQNRTSDKSEEMKLTEKVGTAAVITEFLFKLFPGRSIFIKKKNLLGVVGVHHYYLSMLVASSVTQTRAIRFFNVISVILTSIFADTIFFGIFYPAHSTCSLMTDKVKCAVILILNFSCHNSKSNLCLFFLRLQQHSISHTLVYNLMVVCLSNAMKT